MPSPKPACPSTAGGPQPPFRLLVDIPYAQDLPARAVTRPAMTRVLQQRAGELGVRLHLDAPIAALEPSRDRVLLRWGEHEQVYEGAVIASGSGSDRRSNAACRRRPRPMPGAP